MDSAVQSNWIFAPPRLPWEVLHTHPLGLLHCCVALNNAMPAFALLVTYQVGVRFRTAAQWGIKTVPGQNRTLSPSKCENAMK